MFGMFDALNHQLIALAGMLIAVAFLAVNLNRRAWPGRPGWQYQRVFSAGFAGLLFFVAGLIGWDMSHSHGWFQGTKWVGSPVWWQVSLGAALLLLSGFWARRVPSLPRRS